MGYRLNRLDEPVFMAVSKPLLNEFGERVMLIVCNYVIQTASVVISNLHETTFGRN